MMDITLSDFWLKVIVSSMGSMFGALLFRLLWVAIRDARKWREEEKRTEYTFKRPDEEKPKSTKESCVRLHKFRVLPVFMTTQSVCEPVTQSQVEEAAAAQLRALKREEARSLVARTLGSPPDYRKFL